MNIAIFSGMYSFLGVVLAESLITKYFNAVDLKDLLNDPQIFPTTQSKIKALEAMQAIYAPTGDKPNKVALQAVNTILDELLKESK